MSKFDAKKVMPRYRAISFGLIFFAVLVVGKSLYIMTAKRDYWMKVASRQKKDSVTVKPNRGNAMDFIRYSQTRVLQSLRLTWKKEKPRRRGIG